MEVVMTTRLRTPTRKLVANPVILTLREKSYRMGRCFCCNDGPSAWLYAELYSEHYRCAARNGLTVRQQVVDTGTVSVGDLPLIPQRKNRCSQARASCRRPCWRASPTDCRFPMMATCPVRWRTTLPNRRRTSELRRRHTA